jgi:hypothetical protein
MDRVDRAAAVHSQPAEGQAQPRPAHRQRGTSMQPVLADPVHVGPDPT